LIHRRGYDDADPSIQEEGMMISESEFRSLVSREVIDRNGKSVGYVETIFKDRESGRPEWLGVMTGTWRNHHRLVPATDDLATSTGTVTIPWTKEQVGAAPEYDEPVTPSPRS
jgi:sporulation protein YlmC with PRC-barrel domain